MAEVRGCCAVRCGRWSSWATREGTGKLGKSRCMPKFCTYREGIGKLGHSPNLDCMLVAEQLGDKVKVLKIDVDENQDLSSMLKVSHPACLSVGEEGMLNASHPAG
eukprot:366338-Chlamydomonas_euryale.AAC.2